MYNNHVPELEWTHLLDQGILEEEGFDSLDFTRLALESRQISVAAFKLNIATVAIRILSGQAILMPIRMSNSDTHDICVVRKSLLLTYTLPEVGCVACRHHNIAPDYSLCVLP